VSTDYDGSAYASLDKRALDIIQRGRNREPVSKEECVFMMGFDPLSPEISVARNVANQLVRKTTGNSAVISSQIGVMLNPCPADCKFCNFGISQSSTEPFIMDDDEFKDKVKGITEHGDVRSMNLMTMHVFDIDEMVHKIKLMRTIVPKEFIISLNIGDVDLETCKEFKKAGADKAYHVCRLREGTDTRLRPEARLQTMRNMMDAGLPVSTCTEPIGPEHSVEEIVDNFFQGLDAGCETFAVMRRVAVPGTPLSIHGHITEARLTQMASIFSLALASRKPLPGVNVHEPCQLGFFSGAYLLSAEYGGNPRDRSSETEKNRGMSISDCRKMLFDAGFDNIIGTNGSRIKLDIQYLMRTNSL